MRRQDSQGSLRDFVQSVGDAAERAFEGLAAVGRRASIDVNRDEGGNSLRTTSSRPRQNSSSLHGSPDHLAPPSPHEHPLARLKRAARSATDVRLNSHTLNPTPSTAPSGRFPTSPSLHSGLATPRGGSASASISASASADHLPNVPSYSHPPSARRVVASATRTARTSFESLRKLGRKASFSHSVPSPAPRSPAPPTGEDPWGDPFEGDSPSPSASYRSGHTQAPHRSRPSTATSTSTTSTRLLPLAIPTVSPTTRDKPSRSSTAATSISSPGHAGRRRGPHTSQASSSESRVTSSASGSGPASADGSSMRGWASPTRGQITPLEAQPLGAAQPQSSSNGLHQRRDRDLPPPPLSPRTVSQRGATSPRGLGISGLGSASTTPTLPHLGLEPSPTLPHLGLDPSPLIPDLSSVLSPPAKTHETPTTRLSRLADTMADGRGEGYALTEEQTPIKAASPTLARPPPPVTSEEEDDPLTGLMAAYDIDATDFDESDPESPASDTTGPVSGQGHTASITQPQTPSRVQTIPGPSLAPAESAESEQLMVCGHVGHESSLEIPPPHEDRDRDHELDRDDDGDASPPPTGRSGMTLRAFTPPTPAARRVSSRRRSQTSSARWSVGSDLRKREKGNVPPVPSTPRTPRTPGGAPLTPGERGPATPISWHDGGDEMAPPLPSLGGEPHLALGLAPSASTSSAGLTAGDELVSSQANEVLSPVQGEAFGKHLDAPYTPSPRHERQSIESSLLDAVGPIPPSPMSRFSHSRPSMPPGRRPGTGAIDSASLPPSLKHLGACCHPLYLWHLSLNPLLTRPSHARARALPPLHQLHFFLLNEPIRYSRTPS